MDLTILNLGAGVQSSAIMLLAENGELPRPDAAVFADTQDEPAWVYRQLEYLEKNTSIQIYRCTIGRIGDDLVHGRPGARESSARFAAIPAYSVTPGVGVTGMGNRQCTREYKIDAIGRCIRQEILGLKPGLSPPKGVHVTQWLGFSTDEGGRAARTRGRFDQGPKYLSCEFPLWFDGIEMTRNDCIRYVEEETGIYWRRSACVFCPYQQNSHWRELKKHDPAGFERAVEVDRELRQPGCVSTLTLKNPLFVHRSGKPLDEASLDEAQKHLPGFEDDCEGGCGL